MKIIVEYLLHTMPVFSFGISIDWNVLKASSMPTRMQLWNLLGLIVLSYLVIEVDRWLYGIWIQDRLLKQVPIFIVVQYQKSCSSVMVDQIMSYFPRDKKMVHWLPMICDRWTLFSRNKFMVVQLIYWIHRVSHSASLAHLISK